jgi:hypothetical protein
MVSPKMNRYLDVAIMEMRGLDHCKTWFNRPFPLDIPHYYQYKNFKSEYFFLEHSESKFFFRLIIKKKIPLSTKAKWLVL